jgi:hypothetical protein
MTMRIHCHVQRYGTAITCLLFAGIAGPALAQSALLTLAQSAAPSARCKQVEIRGRVAHLSIGGSGAVEALVLASGAEYAISADGTVDGLVLISGARIVLPPRAAANSFAGVQPGDQIIVRGAADGTGATVIAARVSDDTTGAAPTIMVRADTTVPMPARLAMK